MVTDSYISMKHTNKHALQQPENLIQTDTNGIGNIQTATEHN